MTTAESQSSSSSSSASESGPASGAGPESGPASGAADGGPITCRHCRGSYDPADADEVREHTEPVNCGQSCRCVGRPRCYMCRGSFCMCAAH